jgi:hypothetical protein
MEECDLTTSADVRRFLDEDNVRERGGPSPDDLDRIVRGSTIREDQLGVLLEPFLTQDLDETGKGALELARSVEMGDEEGDIRSLC